MFRSGVVRERPPWIDCTNDKNILHPVPQTITTEPLTSESFKQFGWVIEDPIHSQQSSGDDSLAPSISANQGTARKYANVSQVINKYDLAPSRQRATLQMSLFACNPRKLHRVMPQQAIYEPIDKNPAVSLPHGLFKVEVMERHPFTTQTFAPMGLKDTVSAGLKKTWPMDHDLGTGYVVIVAPTTRTENDEEIPDVEKLRAFLAHGGQAVTYGANVWHSPMAVVGRETVPFLVTQWSNGVAEEDCQELYFEPQQIVPKSFVGVVIKGFTGIV